MKHTANIKRSRRGQATAIGAVLFLALMVLMVAFVQEAYMVQVNMNQVDTERIHENITITSAYLNSDGHLVFNVANRGSNTANLARLWIINQTDNQHLDIPLSNYYVEPGATISDVTSQVLTLGQNYAIRVVTERGNIASYNLVSNVWARVSVYAPSSTAKIGEIVTVYLGITNNDTSGNNIYNLVPTLNVNPVGSLTLLNGPSPSNVTLLPNGESAYFRYVYNVTGSGAPILLTGSFTNAPAGCFDTFTLFANLVPSLRANIQIISPSYNASLVLGTNVTVVLCITNNDTSGNNFYNLRPILAVDPAPSLSLVSGPSPPLIELLPNGVTAFFSYVYTVTGDELTHLLNGTYIGSRTINLNGSFVGAPSGNYNITNLYVYAPDTTDAGSVGSIQLYAESFSFIYQDQYPLKSQYPPHGDPAQNGWNVGGPTNFGQGYPAYTAPASTKLVLSIMARNVDPLNRTIYLNSNTIIKLKPGSAAMEFFIVNMAGGVISAYSDSDQIVLAPGETIRLYFGSATEQTPSTGKSAEVFLLMNGHFDDGTPFSKNWPFISTYTVTSEVQFISSTSGNTGNTVSISYSGFSYNTKIYWFDSTYGTSFSVNQIGNGTTTTATFTVPPSVPGYFAVYVSDGVNVAYVTFQHT